MAVKTGVLLLSRLFFFSFFFFQSCFNHDLAFPWLLKLLVALTEIDLFWWLTRTDFTATSDLVSSTLMKIRTCWRDACPASICCVSLCWVNNSWVKSWIFLMLYFSRKGWYFRLKRGSALIATTANNIPSSLCMEIILIVHWWLKRQLFREKQSLKGEQCNQQKAT